MSNTAQNRSVASSRITFLEGNGKLPKIAVHTPWSEAEIYLHGAQVTHFKKHNEAPLLFLSRASRFQLDSPIRGGIPICFPWFGPRGGVEGQPMHGFARIREWALSEISQENNGEVQLTFKWSDVFDATNFDVQYIVTVGEMLKAEFVVRNSSKERNFSFEECLHTYFHVGAIDKVSVVGLKGTAYLDKTENYSRKQESADQIIIDREVDRTYVNTAATVEILDRALNRKIIVEKQNSRTTVVWNPWIERARQMADLGDEEYKNMVCVESGNAGENKIELKPGEKSSMKISLSSVAF